MMDDATSHGGGKRGPSRFARALARGALRLYPLAWRQRYEAEVFDVLTLHTVSYWTVLDVLLGAADAHLRRDLLPGRLTSMAHRIRTSEIMIFVAFVLFSVGWLSLRFVRDPLPIWEHATQTHPTLLVALTVMDVAGVVNTLAILAGGLPLLASALWAAIRTRHSTAVLLVVVVPLVALAALAGYALLAQPYWTQRQSAAPSAPLTPLAVILQLGLLLMLVLIVVASTWAVAAAIGRSEVSLGALRFALLPGGIATAAMVVGLVAGLVLLALIVSVAPEVGTWPPIEAGIALMLLVAATLALVALRRGLAASRT